MEIVEIHWVDSWVRGGWDSRESYSETQVGNITRVGFLLHQDEDKIILVQSVGKDPEQVSDCIVIPKGCVLSWKRLLAS